MITVLEFGDITTIKIQILEPLMTLIIEQSDTSRSPQIYPYYRTRMGNGMRPHKYKKIYEVIMEQIFLS